MQSGLHVAVLALLAISAATAVRGYPILYHERNHAQTCTEHPADAVAGHLPPVVDK
jgi:hypothetical protein